MDQSTFYQHLVKLSDQYYSASSTISDAAFDKLVDEYEAQYGPFKYLGRATHHQKASLPICMGSLTKCKDAKAIERFSTRNTPVSTYVLTPKLDGISLLVHSSKQGGIQLYTRGDGKVGCNVSHLCPYINIPPTRELHETLRVDDIYIRGELLIAKEYATKFGENLRNIICGAVNSKTIPTDVLQHASFIPYALPSTISKWMTPLEQLQCLQRTKGWKEIVVQFVTIPVLSIKACNELLDTFMQQSQFTLDGLVIAINSYEPVVDEENPKLCIAFKRAGDTQLTKVVQVAWEISRYGTYHPTVEIEPVVFDGCTIQFASGFHTQYIRDHKIGPNAVVCITRSGDVIPHIVHVVQPCAEPQLPPGTEGIDWKMDGVHAKCSIVHDEQSISRLTNAMKIIEAKGVSEATIRKCYDAGLRNEIALFQATVDDILKIKGFQQTSAQKLVTTLQESLPRLSLINVALMSACFAGYGERKLSAIAQQFDFDAYLRTGVCGDISSILNKAGIRSKHDDFIRNCEVFRSQPHLLALLDLVKVFASSSTSATSSAEQVEDTPMQRVVFSGFRDSSLTLLLKSKQIAVVDGVTKATFAVIVKDRSAVSSKVQAAIKHNIPIFTIDEFKTKMNL